MLRKLSLTRAAVPLLSLATLGAPALAQTTRFVPMQYATIQSAIDASNTGDTVLVSPGIYDEHDLVVAKSITIQGVLGPEVTVIDAKHMGRVMLITESPTISGLTLTHGRAPDGFFGLPGLPGIYDSVSGATTSGWPGQDGGAGEAGGAIFASSPGSPRIVNCILAENRAGDGGPGGAGGAGFDGEFGLIAIYNPTSGGPGGAGGHGGDGGAIFVSGGDMLVHQCVFRLNSAGNGGAGGAGGPGGDAYSNSIDCTADGASGGKGGNGGVGGYGGGVLVSPVGTGGGTVDIRQCVFTSASAGYGGSSGFGGPGGAGATGLFCSSAGGSTGSHGQNSGPGLGDSVYAWGGTNCSVVGSIATPVGQSKNPFLGTTSATYSNFPKGDITPGGNIYADPEFVAELQMDYRLSATSPCIDAGDSASLAALTDPAVLVDRDGNPRYHDDVATVDTGTLGPAGEPVIDMGAFEYGAGPAPILPAAYVSAQLGSRGGFGSFGTPLDTITSGIGVAGGGTVAITGGTYAEPATLFSAPARLISSGGAVRVE
ncbi:hypothetical protein [Engelhardtia mirabilis]|uniref:Uncharacterized protein n=1 Tax=Engelhardtia mirabilis TaxID=2528011 RepID=A0A518BFU9_9BACT|nr:hypothetical protein Pla133_09250 [Planctomycetes bacterium Pla133]QDV00185.1 hypothetical protein Pla86_09240 [Planctomycetes bacterium Pla86]